MSESAGLSEPPGPTAAPGPGVSGRAARFSLLIPVLLWGFLTSSWFSFAHLDSLFFVSLLVVIFVSCPACPCLLLALTFTHSLFHIILYDMNVASATETLQSAVAAWSRWTG